MVDRLRLVAARAVDLAAPCSVSSASVLVDQHSGDEAECAPLLISPDDGCSPFATARDLLRDRLRISGKEARRRLRVAGVVCERITTTGEILPPLHPHLAAVSGEVDSESSAEIVRVLERASVLPGITSDVVDELERTLATHACAFDPDRVRTIGRHVVAVLDPDGAEPEETDARTRQGVHIGRLYNGLASVRLVVDAVQLEVLQTAFDAGSNPRTSTPPLFAGAEVPPAGGSGGAQGVAPASASTTAPVGGGCVSAVRGLGASDEPVPGLATGEIEADVAPEDAGLASGGADSDAAPVDARTRPQRQLDALVAAVAAAIRHGVLPDTGGTPTQVVVTLDARDLPQPTAPGIASSGPENEGSQPHPHPPHRRTAASLAQSVGQGATLSGPENEGSRGCPPTRRTTASLAPPGGRGASPHGPRDERSRECPPSRRTTASLAPPNPLLPSRGVAQLPHVGPVPARMVRHLACDATITAVVLGNGRRVLDVGQSVRIVPPWMRLAVIARDGTECAFPGCSIPASWCEAHHIVPWQRGGPTSVDNTVMLCPHHHALTDRGDWAIHRDRPGATPTFRVRR